MTALHASKWCLVHAAVLVGAVVGTHSWTLPPAVRTACLSLWLVGLLCWPVWCVVIRRDKAHFTEQALAFLVAGTVLWVIAVLPVAGVLLLALLWRGN